MRKLFTALLAFFVLFSPALAVSCAGQELSHGDVLFDSFSATASLSSRAKLEIGAKAGLRDFLYWPTGRPVAVPRRFDPPAQKWLPGHRGIDIRVTPGETVYAATDATVLFAGELAGRPLVSLQDSSGRRYTYEPVEPSVKVGDEVFRADAIGTALGGHFAGDDRLHFGVKDGPEGYVDPLKLLGGRIRLWPIK
ncbi:MAG: M23 family metallopeptidase [Mobiluncus porci]|uniref:M23 family metallopeptidase n=1 Tax=Mobiluncus porci TaxID=2652278 RepID=UPI0023F205F3|nr:M23 family metallopeptidase [Mobiluncus porci]MDD7541132.1 M23 family metallopeptidase [Mobiluncus porci]MDY5748020.1 M23 family metallopeptidase [Mobiluncus porci]